MKGHQQTMWELGKVYTHIRKYTNIDANTSIFTEKTSRNTHTHTHVIFDSVSFSILILKY